MDPLECYNCKRQQIVTSPHARLEDDNDYLIFVPLLKQDVNKRRKFRNFGLSGDLEQQIIVCSNCHNYLTIENTKTASQHKHVWPSFMWNLLINKDIHDAYGSNIWKLFPMNWRRWWINTMPQVPCFHNITMDSPPAVIVDKSTDLSEFNQDIATGILATISKTINKHLMPTILCPWGCSEYMHLTGMFEMDILLQRFLLKVKIKLISDEKRIKHIQHARDDFFRDERIEYDRILLNPKWIVLPSLIICNDKGPMIMTCRNHNKGCKKMYIHIPRAPTNHNLCSKLGDQLCHSVLKCRTISPLKARKYTTTYQMHEQRGSFQGIDTCNITEYGNFKENSVFLDQSESYSIVNRLDINALLDQLVKKYRITKKAAECMRQRANTSSPPKEMIDKCLHGATYLPLEEAMALQKMLTVEESIRIVIDHTDEGDENVEINEIEEHHQANIITTKPNWITKIVYAQKIDSGRYGAYMPVVPSFSNRTIDTRLIWVTSAIITQNQMLWELTCKIPMFTSKWHGWLLTYLTTHCFDSFVRSKTTPFKRKFISSVSNICKKFGSTIDYEYNSRDIKQVFSEHESVYMSRIQNNFQTHILETYNVIILYKDHLSNGNVLDIEDMSNININDDQYELRTIILTKRQQNRSINSWNGTILSRHGSPRHSSWWKQDRQAKYCLQATDNYISSIDMNDVNVLVFSRITRACNDKHKEDFLNYIGGQTCVQCDVHKVPLITSYNKDIRCYVHECNRRAQYCCPVLGCKSAICKICFRGLDKNQKHYVRYNTSTNIHNSEANVTHNNDDYDDNSTSSCESIDEVAFQRALHQNRQKNINLDSDDDEDNHSIDEQDEFNEMSTDIPFEEIDENEFITTTSPSYFFEEEERPTTDEIPTTNQGETPYLVADCNDDDQYQNMRVNGHVLLNQACTLLSRHDKSIRGYAAQKHFLERIVTTSPSISIPLLYPEAMMFPSIFFSMVPEDGSIVGAMPSCLLAHAGSRHGFANIKDHHRNRLLSFASSTSTSPGYISLLFDISTNLTLNRQDSRIILNRGLVVAQNEIGLDIQHKDSSSIHDSIDSKQMVRNLCASQKYHTMHYFLTFTCNQKLHFGTSAIKNWLDGEEWKEQFPNYHNRPKWEQHEIHDQLIQAAGPLLLRNWMETRIFLIEYLRGSDSSPYFPTDSIFVRDEYQDTSGNLPHIHLMLSLDFDKLTVEQKERFDDIIRSSYGDLVRPDEVEDYIEEGIFKNIHEIEERKDECRKLCQHRCTKRCYMRVGHDGKPTDYRCRKTNNLRVSPDNTKHCQIPIPNHHSEEVIQILQDIGMAEVQEVNEYGCQTKFTCCHPYFHPVKHIPPTLTTFDCNMSPVEGKTFCVCRSQQNIQSLIGTNGTNKYICKYCSKMDKSNYVVFRASPHDSGRLISQQQFLHNTKISSSAYNEKKAIEASQDAHHPKGRAIPLLQIYQMQLGYTEVHTDLNFTKVPTLPYEQRVGTEKVAGSMPTSNNNNNHDNSDDYNNVPDGADVTILSHEIRSELNLPPYRMHRESELLTLDSIMRSPVSIDRISKFSIRPPELRAIFNQPGDYFRWFHISSNKLDSDQVKELLAAPLTESKWFDGVLDTVKIRDTALKEVNIYLNTLEITSRDPCYPIYLLFKNMCRLHEIEDELGLEDNIDIDTWLSYRKFIFKQTRRHLPVPVFNYIKPTMSTRFILHILLSMGRFETEYDLMLQPNIKESLRYAKLIGPQDDDLSLQDYSNRLLRKYIEQQLVHFPNSNRVTDSWIIAAKMLFDSVILRNEIPISDMPPILQADLDFQKEAKVISILQSFKENMILSAYDEMKHSIDLHSIPTQEAMKNVENRGSALDWNALGSFTRNQNQSVSSYNEQCKALKNAFEAIDDYLNPERQHLFTKSRVILGFPGSGKSYLMSYIMLYALSKGLRICVTAMMSKRANVLGGTHIHKLFRLPCKGNQNLHRLAELAIIAMHRQPEWIQVLSALNILFIDEIGQISAEMLSALDIILRKVRRNNTFFGGLLIISTMDHKQLPPVKGTPFLVSSHIITCFKFSVLKHSVRASQDVHLERTVNIARMNPDEYTPQVLNEFKDLIANSFTHVNDWKHELITPDVFRIFSKKLPAKESIEEYINQVKYQLQPGQYIERESYDLQNRVSSLSEWIPATQRTRVKLDKILKEPRFLLFFVGALFEFTYNQENSFSQSQLGLMIDLPDPQDVIEFKKIRLLVAPPGLKTFIYSGINDPVYYITRGWKMQYVATAREYDIAIPGSLKGRRIQYGLKHHVTSTVHSCQGDTLHKIATEVSHVNKNFKLWDKGQVVVLLSRTRKASDVIFVGNKMETIRCLVSLIQKKSQWSDYMENIIELVDVDNNILTTRPTRVFRYDTFPFEFKQIPLPICNTGYVYFLVSF